MLVENIDKKIIKCQARKAFTLGYASVKQGETFFLVRSERRLNRYYLVKFNTERRCYQCSCGGGTCEHDHLKTVREYVTQHPVKEQAETPMITANETTTTTPETLPLNRIEKPENAPVTDETAQTTPIDWKAVVKRDRARQRAYYEEYRQKAQALREAARMEAEQIA